jgi:hypothetical protein
MSPRPGRLNPAPALTALAASMAVAGLLMLAIQFVLNALGAAS